MAPKNVKKTAAGKTAKTDKKAPKKWVPVSRDYTIHLAKSIFGVTFKKRAPRALREIKRFAEKAMGTGVVKVDTSVNKYCWKQGIRNPPRRIRIRLERKYHEGEDSKKALYTLVSLIEVDSFKNLVTEKVAENAE
eukprot:CAMPEP_0184643982 /NCGR_PEP_ID=MMETSP0308-20130426/778_1 /TAXON_ID=38269 /ORGANISM="Gloeochaete witrockiana, Strain SAG 46.84" /LENGTH=134 /DNA_ID=CAMNT_0027072263 /DNA_START=23 /DNA_END=427 /DNA_ORIENTATION=+